MYLYALDAHKRTMQYWPATHGLVLVDETGLVCVFRQYLLNMELMMAAALVNLTLS